MSQKNVEEIVVPKDLKEFLNDIVEKKHGYELGEPWKFSDESLLVVVPILRKNSPDRMYTTMYEVLKDLGMKDTGSIDKVELQNKSGKPIFVRAGTIFTGKTQSRAAQHSGVYKPLDEMKIDIPVRCVHQTHGIRSGSEMEFGSIAPMSITLNLMSGNQSAVWNSVRDYTRGKKTSNQNDVVFRGYSGISGICGWSGYSDGTHYAFNNTSSSLDRNEHTLTAHRQPVYRTAEVNFDSDSDSGSDDLMGYLKSKGKEALDEMMQKVPLFENQAGAIIFNPTGVLAVETFDSPKSWEAIKQEIIEKYGDKVSDKQAEHLFELNKDMILPLFKKFVAALDKMEEKVIRQDDFSETRSVRGDKVVGEYTLIKGRTIHCLLIKE